MTATRNILLDLADLLAQLRTTTTGLAATGPRSGKLHSRPGSSGGIRAEIIDPWICGYSRISDKGQLYCNATTDTCQCHLGTVNNTVVNAVRMVCDELQLFDLGDCGKWTTRTWAGWLAGKAATVDALELADGLTAARDAVQRIISPGHQGTVNNAALDQARLAGREPLDQWIPVPDAVRLALTAGTIVGRATAYRWVAEAELIGSPAVRTRPDGLKLVQAGWLVTRMAERDATRQQRDMRETA